MDYCVGVSACTLQVKLYQSSLRSVADSVSGSNAELVQGRRLSPWLPGSSLLVLLSISEINVVLLLIIIVGMLEFLSSLKKSFACLFLKTLLPAWVTCHSSTHYQITVLVYARKDCWYLWTGKPGRGSFRKQNRLYWHFCWYNMYFSMRPFISTELFHTKTCILNRQGHTSKSFFKWTVTLPVSLALFILEI